MAAADFQEETFFLEIGRVGTILQSGATVRLWTFATEGRPLSKWEFGSAETHLATPAIGKCFSSNGHHH